LLQMHLLLLWLQVLSHPLHQLLLMNLLRLWHLLNLDLLLLLLH
jgi:hypothetical protein